MEEKVMRQKSFPSEYLDDMLLASFLNDEYGELQEDVQENIFGLQDGTNEKESPLEEDAQENVSSLQDETRLTEKTSDTLSYTHSNTESGKIMFEEIKVVNASKIQEVKKNLSVEMVTSANVNNEQVLEQLNAGDSTLRKRNVDVLETKKMQESEKNHISSTKEISNEVYCNNRCLEKFLNAEDNQLTSRNIGILANEKLTNSNEVTRSNGSILRNGPMNAIENAEISTSQDEKTQLQSDNIASICTGSGNRLACKDSFLLSIKICFIILLFLSLLYYFLIQKR